VLEGSRRALEDGQGANVRLGGLQSILGWQIAVDTGSDGCIDEIDLRGGVGDVSGVDEGILALQSLGEARDVVVIDFLDCNLGRESSSGSLASQDSDIEELGCKEPSEEWGAGIPSGLDLISELYRSTLE
jgi:hypothetical protein